MSSNTTCFDQNSAIKDWNNQHDWKLSNTLGKNKIN